MPGPAVQKPSPYITPQGWAALETELKSLWQRRAGVTAALAAAAAEGDRSENAEYIYRKKELRDIDRRIRYLQRRMPGLKIVSAVDSHDRIYFGAWVRLEDDRGNDLSYRIVGADELDAGRNHISIDSPLGRSLLGKAVNDEVRISAGACESRYVVIEIRYSSVA